MSRAQALGSELHKVVWEQLPLVLVFAVAHILLWYAISQGQAPGPQVSRQQALSEAQDEFNRKLEKMQGEIFQRMEP